MKVIAISGAHASGKSTFVKSIAGHPALSRFLIFDDGGNRLFRGKKEEKIKNLKTVLSLGYDILFVGNWTLKSIYRPLIEWSHDYKLLYIVSVVSLNRLKGELTNRKIKANKPVEKIDSWHESDAGLRYIKEVQNALVECNYPANVKLYVANHSDTVGDWSEWENVKLQVWRFLNVVP